ncbi:hypothetical protein E0K89_019310 [Aquicoccus sp. SCR17]|nr:hypothetical protein [Carideicomes alvinocaridis]
MIVGELLAQAFEGEDGGLQRDIELFCTKGLAPLFVLAGPEGPLARRGLVAFEGDLAALGPDVEHVLRRQALGPDDGFRCPLRGHQGEHGSHRLVGEAGNPPGGLIREAQHQRPVPARPRLVHDDRHLVGSPETHQHGALGKQGELLAQALCPLRILHAGPLQVPRLRDPAGHEQEEVSEMVVDRPAGVHGGQFGSDEIPLHGRRRKDRWEMGLRQLRAESLESAKHRLGQLSGFLFRKERHLGPEAPCPVLLPIPDVARQSGGRPESQFVLDPHAFPPGDDGGDIRGRAADLEDLGHGPAADTVRRAVGVLAGTHVYG